MAIDNSGLEWSGSCPHSLQTADDGWRECVWHLPPDEEFSSSCILRFSADTAPFWCLPGLFWGDNGNETTGQYYPRFKPDLSAPSRFVSSFWEFDISRFSQPLAAAHDGHVWRILQVQPYAYAGEEPLGCSLGFQYRDGEAMLLASLPSHERPYRPVGHDYTMPLRHTFRRSCPQEIRWRVRVLVLPGDQNAILDFLAEEYHRIPSRLPPEKPAVYAAATRNALLRWHYAAEGEGKYFKYTVAFDRVSQQLADAAGFSIDRHEMPLGWASGWAVLEPLIAHAVRSGDKEALAAASGVWQHLAHRGGLVSPSGFWWTRYSPAGVSGRNATPPRRPDGWDGNWMEDAEHLHMRTLADAVLRAARTVRLYGEHLPFSGELREQVRRQAVLAAGLAREGWPLPLGVHARTGRPIAMCGTAGMLWLAVWCELAQMNCWDDTALIKDGLDHYRPAVWSGRLNGAPEDIGECPGSEDTYIAIETYLAGYALCGREEDLATCIRAAKQLYFWRKAFTNYLDPRTIVGVYQLDSRGGDIASFKNHALHIYGLDADRTLRILSELMGQTRWSDLADDHWAFAAQLTPLVDGQFNAYEGMVTEQFYFCDWAAAGNSVFLLEDDKRRASYDFGCFFRNHGNIAGFSHAWCTAFILLAANGRVDGSSLDSGRLRVDQRAQ